MSRLSTLHVTAMPPVVLTKTEAAKALKVSTRTVERWIGSGMLQKLRNTTRTLIPASSIKHMTEEWAR